MSAKDRHQQVLLDYLSNPDNRFPSRGVLSLDILGFKQTQQLYKIFTLEELAEIERQALEMRRKRCASYLARVDRALLKKAATGDVQASKLAYQRFEGWSEKHRVDATVSGGISLQVGFVGGSSSSAEETE